MEIYPIDYGLAIYGTRERLNHATALSHWRMGALMTREQIREDRAQYLELRRLRALDLPMQHRIAVKRQAGFLHTRTKLAETTEGIIEWGGIYFTLTEDTRVDHDNVVPFWSREARHLATKVDENGIRIFANNEFLYPLEALDAQFTSDEAITILGAHLDKLRTFSLHTAALSGGNFTSHHQRQCPDGQKIKQITYSFKNDYFAISVRQRPKENGGGWVVRLSDKYEEKDYKERYTESNNNDSDNKILKYGFNNGYDYDFYETKAEALAVARMIHAQAGQLLWQGKDPTSFQMDFPLRMERSTVRGVSSIYNAARREGKNKDNIREAISDIVFFIIGSIGVRAAIPVISIPVAIGLTVATNLGARRVKDKIFSVIEWASYRLSGPRSIYGNAGTYIAKSKDNFHRRINPKHNPSEIPYLKVLDGQDVDLTDSQSSLTPPDSEFNHNNFMDKILKIGTIGLTHKRTMIDPYTALYDVYNGLSVLANWDPEKEILTSYVRFNPILASIPQISLTDDEKEYLANGRIFKITDPKGDHKREMQSVTYAAMCADLNTRLFLQSPKIKGRRKSIRYRIPSELVKSLAQRQISSFFNSDVASHPQGIVANNPKDEIDPHRLKSRQSALKHFFGGEKVTIPDPSPELIEFYKGVEFADQKYPIDVLNL